MGNRHPNTIRDRIDASLANVGERAAVASILARIATIDGEKRLRSAGGLLVGPGDDAAALHLPAGEAAVLTTDTLVENVHFERAWTSADDLGFKLIQAAASDIGAMGARPLAAVVAVSVPAMMAEKELLALVDGMLAAAGEHDLALAGGDTTESPILVLTASVLGGAPPEALCTRSGARAGDRLLVTGELGDAAAGLRLLRELEHDEPLPAGNWLRPQSALHDLEGPPARHDRAGRESDPALVIAARRFLRPSPPIAAGAIAAKGGATALIDISDGLASEISLIAEASGVGMIVDASKIPIGPGARAWAARAGEDPLGLALHGGEDYELLIAVPPARMESLVVALAAGGVASTLIGEVVPRAEGIMLRELSGTTRPLDPGGYEHFGSFAP